ncbi:MAG: hypothetical protein RR994_00730 [Clostridia bacterium]
MKRVLSFLLTLIMVFSCSIGIFSNAADKTDYKQAYSAYKTLYRDVYSPAYYEHLDKLEELMREASKTKNDSLRTFVNGIRSRRFDFWGTRVTVGKSRYDVPQVREAMYEAERAEDFDLAVERCNALTGLINDRIAFMKAVADEIDDFGDVEEPKLDSSMTLRISDELYDAGVRFYTTPEQSAEFAQVAGEDFRITAFRALRYNGEKLQNVEWTNLTEQFGYVKSGDKKTPRTLKEGEPVSNLDATGTDKSLIHNVYFPAGTHLSFEANCADIVKESSSSMTLRIPDDLFLAGVRFKNSPDQAMSVDFSKGKDFAVTSFEPLVYRDKELKNAEWVNMVAQKGYLLSKDGTKEDWTLEAGAFGKKVGADSSISFITFPSGTNLTFEAKCSDVVIQGSTVTLRIPDDLFLAGVRFKNSSDQVMYVDYPKNKDFSITSFEPLVYKGKELKTAEWVNKIEKMGYLLSKDGSKEDWVLAAGAYGKKIGTASSISFITFSAGTNLTFDAVCKDVTKG